MISKSEHVQAPGIGVLGEMKPSNYGTRLVKVVPGLLTPAVLNNEVGEPAFRAPGITRSIVKGVSRQPFGIGEMVLDHTAPFTVEAQIPFVGSDGNMLYWTVVGRNAPERMPSPAVVEKQHQLMREVALDPKYAPQTIGQMAAFIEQKHPGLRYSLERVTPDNFPALESSLRTLYAAAFSDYPYDVVSAIGGSCGDQNLFVVAKGQDNTIYSVTGAEYLPMGNGVTVAEIGDSASLPGLKGFGALLKGALLQTMVQTDNVPDLVFTDSRLADDGSVLKANRRAGLQLQVDPAILLPCHTTISSDRNHGAEIMQRSASGEIFPVENMTMMYLSRAGVQHAVKTYGNIT